MSGVEDEGRPGPEHGDMKADPLSVTVSAHSSSADRTVFVDEENPDGWISSELTVPLEP